MSVLQSQNPVGRWRMNHCVPDFEIEEEGLNLSPISSELPRQQGKSKLIDDDELFEVVWKNGQVVFQSQRSPKKSSQTEAVLDVQLCVATAEEGASRHLSLQEAEMASWLHYPDPLEEDICADLLYTSPTSDFSQSSRVSQIQEENRIPAAAPAPAPAPAPLSRSESTVIDSNMTPAVGPGSGVSHSTRSSAPFSRCGSMTGDTLTSTDAVVGEVVSVEPTVTSSSGDSGGSADRLGAPPSTDRKRKGIEADDAECRSEVSLSLLLFPEASYIYCTVEVSSHCRSTPRTSSALRHLNRENGGGSVGNTWQSFAGISNG
ncbi:transcription factor PIF1-like isoform X2 [Macadamia integrifolia]|uniref:transcription factor PIF1-like isoform X2 n=1 Tax=Macadamia integrifolia TaxID=60698 RepID=UPI001C4F4F9F|nr:transcription factor PIF1-like isoform X2 [Macadamia integrifolia]XP_042499634.1 transcription factor PIF1-like isoform X2 [Macadamia integrifolia]